ncbi:hypothetical protein THZB04_100079 [Vibrio owensii]|nr:hypothetical protein THZB04_100079 [Vibrio owensii]
MEAFLLLVTHSNSLIHSFIFPLTLPSSLCLNGLANPLAEHFLCNHSHLI